MKNNSARSYKALSGDSHRHKCFQNVALKAKFMVLCLRSSLAMQREGLWEFNQRLQCSLPKKTDADCNQQLH